MALEELRNRIDETDRKIVKLIAERTRIAQEIGRYKKQNGEQIINQQREETVLQNVKNAARQEKISPVGLENIYRLIIIASRQVQGISIAFQGETSAYSEEAAYRFSGPEIETKPCEGLEKTSIFREDAGVFPKSRQRVNASMKVAIIGGAGKMGKWFARYLLGEGIEVVISGRDRNKLRETEKELGVTAAGNIEAAKQADVIVLSVPLESLTSVAEEISPFITDEQVIIDISSVKVLSMKVLHHNIKKGTILGVHPMFGPGASGISGHNFILTPTGGAEIGFARKVETYLEARGARVSIMTPEEHDEKITVVLGLSHFIALVSADTLLSLNNLKELEPVSGTTFRMLLTLIGGALSDDPELYASLQMNLPGLTKLEILFQERAKSWAETIGNRDIHGFTERVRCLKDRLAQESPLFEKAYGNMYRLVEGP